MEGGTLAEAVKSYDFKEPHAAYVAQEVVLMLLSCTQNTVGTQSSRVYA